MSRADRSEPPVPAAPRPLVVLVGPAGCGKTTVGRRLAARLDVEFVDGDDLHATADELDEIGRVIDFSMLRDRIGGWIEKHWDHGFLCHKDDKEVQRVVSAIEGQKVFLLDSNPTAENLAWYLLHVVGPQQLAGTNARLVRVALWETENCGAEVSL